MTNERIFLSPPHMGGNEQKYVQEAFDLNWVSPAGPHLEKFEKVISQYSGVPHVGALSSGTAAIHLALIILGIKAGDEVLCSTFTFSGSCNPIKYVGATPIFVESEAETWNMSPEFLEAAIKDRISKGHKPKAVIIVDLYGTPATLDELVTIARKYDIPVIEDAAEALGADYKGEKCGSFGDIGIYSFNGNKIITTSGGGALVSKNKEYVEKAKFLATQARDDGPHYQHSQIGYNYRLSNISAAIGIGQMEVLDDRVKRRREIYRQYKELLQDIEDITFHELPEEYGSNRWLTTILINKEDAGGEPARETIRKMLEMENIESRPLWKPMHLQPVYQDAPYYGDRLSEALFAKGLCLPSGTAMRDEDVQKVAGLLKLNFESIKR